jgi:FKBP-type peptidyl-prolyl cis-trans isomerase FkpA
MLTKMIKRLLSLLMILSCITISCKKDTRDLSTAQDQVLQNYLNSNNLSFTKDTSGFYYKILQAGTGDSLKNSSLIYYLQSYKLTNGAELVTSDKYNFNVNYLGYVRPIGFRNSIFAMVKQGGKIRSLIPSYLAFGKDGSGIQIPGNSIIDATFEVINANSVVAVEDTLINRYIQTLGTTFTRDSSGVYYNIINPGNGTKDVTLSSVISANYTGKFFNGVQFDASASGSPLSATLGTGVIKGWQTLTHIKKGGKIHLLIPSYKAYGTTGNGQIPSNTPLDFEIELVDVN